MKYIGENAIKKLISLIKGDLATKQPTITASGLLKGDGAGTVTAADTQEATLVDVPNGLLKGDGTTISVAVPGTDYAVPSTEPVVTPHIGANGNWFIGDTDTGVAAEGQDGTKWYTGLDYPADAKIGDLWLYTSVSHHPDGFGLGDVSKYDGTTWTVLANIRGAAGKNGKSAYEYAQDSGYAGTETEFSTDINPDNIKGDLNTYIVEELAKRGQLKPEFANSVDELTASGDATKLYVLPDGYIYAYRTFKSYNLLKLSEVSYSSRLQNDVAGIIASNANNLVTGWIPVKYGKYYTPSILFNGSRIVGNSAFSLIVRVNVKLADGTIIVYGNTFDDRNKILYTPGVNETITLEHENAVAVMLHFFINNQDISTQEKFEAYQPMVIEGNSIEDATNKATTYEYISGDAEEVANWYNTGHAFVPADYEDRIIKLESDVNNLKQNQTSVSPYFRDVNFGVLPFAYYKGVADSYENSAFGWTTKYTDFIAMWKSVVANHSGYVTETALGAASDGQTIYLYDFNPVRLSNADKPIPKIIIIAGQHGGETCNIFGLYYFVENLLNKWNQHPSLEYLRNNVELMIIPVLNTYGFDNQSYKNANGVNLNRNYDSNWELLDDTTSSQYGGAEPFDQPETQIVRNLLLNNTDAVIVIDSHVNGGGKVANYSDINYYGISTSTDAYFNRMVDAVAHNLSAISANFNIDYNLDQPNVIMGFLNNNDGKGILRDWGRDNNFVTVLVEGFGGFPNRTAYTAEVFKANEEIIVNWLITAMNYLGK